jgi:uncharacterized membrane protein (UPF0127 family)
MTKDKKPSAKNPLKNTPVIYKTAGLLIIVLAALYFIFVYPGKKGDNSSEEYMFKRNGELTFINTSGTPVRINIQIAISEYDRELGLMFRKSMEENQGMLFIFPDTRVRSFWMMNTLIPLDMIFIDSTKTILNIAKNTTPYSDSSYTSVGPAKYVLEVNGGFTERHNIRPGDKISWTGTR